MLRTLSSSVIDPPAERLTDDAQAHLVGTWRPFLCGGAAVEVHDDQAEAERRRCGQLLQESAAVSLGHALSDKIEKEVVVVVVDGEVHGSTRLNVVAHTQSLRSQVP